MGTLLVASSGGHLQELMELRPRLGALSEDVRWVTFDTPQTRSELAGEDVVFARYTPPRDYRGVAVNTRLARTLLTRGVQAVVSTGSGIALSFLPLARLLGIPAHYIESATRTDGPSRSGQVLERCPGVSLYTQCPGWASGRWRYGGSVLDPYEAAPAVTAGPVRRVVVTLGALPYGFPRLVARLLRILPPDAEVLWQTGCTPMDAFAVDHRAYVPAVELQRAMAAADVVIGHAGCGSLLSALAAGRCPVLVPRSTAHGENVDDHQLGFAHEVDRRGLAVTRTPEELTAADIQRAAGLRAHEREPLGFALSGGWGPMLRPGSRRLDLRGQLEQRRLRERRTDELHRRG